MKDPHYEKHGETQRTKGAHTYGDADDLISEVEGVILAGGLERAEDDVEEGQVQEGLDRNEDYADGSIDDFSLFIICVDFLTLMIFYKRRLPKDCSC